MFTPPRASLCALSSFLHLMLEHVSANCLQTLSQITVEQTDLLCMPDVQNRGL